MTGLLREGEVRTALRGHFLVSIALLIKWGDVQLGWKVYESRRGKRLCKYICWVLGEGNVPNDDVSCAMMLSE